MTVRILAVCGNGQGSSMIMKMKVDQFLTQSNIDHTVNSCAVGEYKSEPVSYTHMTLPTTERV